MKKVLGRPVDSNVKTLSGGEMMDRERKRVIMTST